MSGNVVPVSTGSYSWYESLIPFHVPREVEDCEAFLGDQQAAAKFPLEERQRVTHACTVVVDEHRKIKLFQKILILLGVMGVVSWFRGRRGKGSPGGGGAIGADGDLARNPQTDARADRVAPREEASAPARRKKGREQPASAVRQDADRVWADTTKEAFGGWVSAGSIPHMGIQPGTRFILSALERARRDYVSRPHEDPFHILEVGSDIGRLAGLMADRLGVRVHATDVKPVEAFNDGSSPLILFQRASAVRLPVGPGSVPAWVSSFTWEYVGPRALDEAYRVLSDGGVIVAISHYQGSSTSRMIVALGRLATRALELEKMPRRSDKKFRAYQSLLADIERETEWGGSRLERAINRGAFRNYARWAFFGELKTMHRAGLEVQATAGRQLEWIIGMSTDEIRSLFEARGFEVVEMRPVHFRLLGVLPSVSHEGLGIVARKREGGGTQAGPAAGSAPASSSGSSSPAKAGGGQRGTSAAAPAFHFVGVIEEGDRAPFSASPLVMESDEGPGADGFGVFSGAACYNGLPLWTVPASPAAAFAR